jgi:hypothetical protein
MKRMSRLLTAYARMLDASVRAPERFPGPRPVPDEAARQVRVVALLRALTPDEATALLSCGKLPERLAALAGAAGLPVEECGRILAGVARQLAEGLRPTSDPGR